MSRKLTLKIAVFVVSAVVVGILGFYLQPKSTDTSAGSANSLETKNVIVPPNTKLIAVSGESTTLDKYKGKVVLLNFWASWCGPCIHEMPALYELQKSFNNQNFSVLGINMDTDAKVASTALEKRFGKSPFPLFKGDEEEISNLFSISGLPFNVLIDKNGVVQKILLGEMDWRNKSLHKLIESYL